MGNSNSLGTNAQLENTKAFFKLNTHWYLLSYHTKPNWTQNGITYKSKAHIMWIFKISPESALESTVGILEETEYIPKYHVKSKTSS